MGVAMRRIVRSLFVWTLASLTSACGSSHAPDDAPLALDPASPTRKLIDVGLFEGTTAQNRVMDPLVELDAIAQHSWILLPRNGNPNFSAHRHVLRAAPSGQTAVYVPPVPENGDGLTIGLAFKLSNERMLASV